MLGKTNATANIAVKDLAVAKKFYEGTLGLTQVDAEGDEVIVMKSGDTLINVYRSRVRRDQQGDRRDLDGRRRDRRDRQGAEGQGRRLRALRHARHEARRRSSMSATA